MFLCKCASIQVNFRWYLTFNCRFKFRTLNGNIKDFYSWQIPSEIDLNASTFTQKHALLIRVYGGPGSLRVTDSFGISYHSYLITTKKVVHCEIDGRGTANKGIDLMFSVNNKLGTYEMDDQISITK